MNRGQLRDRANIFDLQPLEVRRFFTTAALSNGTLTVTGTNSAETITINRNSSARITVTGVTATFAAGSVARIVVNAQGGSDTITITGAVGSNVPSTINAGEGNDLIATGLGDDVIFGQGGFDTVNYSARTAKVTVSLDGAQNDGETQNGETDNVNTEEVLGGSGNDVFTGNDSANYFTGGAGNDQIAAGGGSDELVGNTGNDALFGEGGDDALYAKNNDVDTVNGGTGPTAPDADLAEIDGVDVSSGAAAASFARRAAIALQAAGVDPAVLDTTYGGNGTGLNSSPDFSWDEVTAATVDSQGRVIVVGHDFRSNGFGYDSEDMVAVRFNADGTLDEGFGYGGEVVVDFTPGPGYSADDDQAFGVTTDPDDNIIIVGSSMAFSENNFDDDVALVRLNEADGSLDGGAGLLRRYDDVFVDSFDDTAVDAVVQDDGQIVIVANSIGEGSAIAVMRVDGTTGDLDDSFDGDGVSLLNFGFSRVSSVALQTLPADAGSQRIIVGGFDLDDVLAENFLVVRLTSAGAIDGTFAGDVGYVSVDINDGSTDILNDLAVTSDNEIVAVGQSYFPIGLTFALEPFPNFSSRGAVLHVSADGTSTDVDTTSETDISFNAVAVGDDDSIYIAGTDGSDFVLARYLLPATQDPNFNSGELVFTDFTPGDVNEWTDYAVGLGVLPDGKVVVGGSSSFLDSQTQSTVTLASVARYGSDSFEVEEFLDYDDVQNDPGTGKRSATATFYLKSTHLDDQGRAIIDLTDGNDTLNFLRITAGNGDQQILVEYNGLYLPFDLTTTSITINCKNGNDTINGTDLVTIPLIINGGGGIDNIRGGGRNDIIRGGDGLDILAGGAGNDVILGEQGIAAIAGLVDLLSGDAGNDILIGGIGPDALNGGTGEDILIGGTTAFDNNNEALASLSAEWGDTSKTNAQRVANLKGPSGGLNGSNFLIGGSTVFNDNVVDLYTGGSGRDWFFRRVAGNAAQRDTILDNSTGEELTIL